MKSFLIKLFLIFSLVSPATAQWGYGQWLDIQPPGIWYDQPPNQQDPSATSLLTGLKFYSNLSSTSSQVGGVTFTNNNGVTFDATGNYANFVSASSQYLNTASSSALQLGNEDYSVVGWFYVTTDATGVAMTKRSAGSGIGAAEYQYYYNAANDSFNWAIFNEAHTFELCNTQTGISTVTWYFAAIWYVKSSNKTYFSINNGTPNEHTVSLTQFAGSANFFLGSQYGSSFFNGRIGKVGIWSRVITPTEITYLYNGGAGRTHAGGIIAMNMLYDEKAYHLGFYSSKTSYIDSRVDEFLFDTPYERSIKSLIGYSMN